jgi:aminobenzoyl-glutamate utilization protein B
VEHHGIKAYLFQWMEEHKQEIYELSDYMWEHPELGLEEFEASSRIRKIFSSHGFSVESGIGGLPTSFIAAWGEAAPVFGINVEYDCLPGLSQKKDSDLPDPVIQGAPGQGCGHNILGPAAVFAGIALRYALEEFSIPGTIKMFGSPYEESSVGKPVMGKAGAYKGTDFILDWHPWYDNRADYDTCNSVFIVQYRFAGRTCHGASPWEGRSALDAGMLFGHALEMLREHLIPGNPAAAHTINYTFSDTGPAFANIVPDTTAIILYGRFNDMEVAGDAYRRISLCAKGAAMATETTISERLITFTHNKLPNKTLAEVVHRNLEELGAPEYTDGEQERVRRMQKAAGLDPVGLATEISPFQFSEAFITDASEFSWNAPYATFDLALGPKGGWHNWMVTACAGSSIGKKCLDKAAKILVSSAIDILLNPGLIDRAKEELKERLGGRLYESLIPDGYEPPIGFNRSIMEQFFPDRRTQT